MVVFRKIHKKTNIEKIIVKNKKRYGNKNLKESEKNP